MEYSNRFRPLLSVVVCTYNRASLLADCLLSLANQTIDKDLFEVIVVDNNSTDGTEKVVREISGKYANFRYVKEQIQGLSSARNRGWCEAIGSHVAYIDDDARAAPNWCERILLAFGTVSPSPIAVGGEVHPFYEISPPKWFSDEFEIRSWGSGSCFLQPPRAGYGFSGSNMAFPREVLQHYQGFSTRYGMSGGKLEVGEETDLFSRIYSNTPLFWYDPDIKVFHWVPKNNMRVSYRFWRSFKGGESLASIERKKLFSLGYVKNLIELLYFLLTLPISFIKSDNGIATEAVMRLEELGFRCGYLIGAVININKPIFIG